MTDSNNVSRRRFLQATGGAAAAASLAGCGGGGDGDTTTTTETTTTPPEEKPEGKTYQLVNSTITTLDPVAATDEASAYLIHNIYDCLTNYPDAYTNVEGLLAEDWSVSEDGTVITFKLKEGVTFSDGTELTASDLAYSWERLAASENSRRSAFILDNLGVAHETETTTVETDSGTEENEVYKSGTLGVEAKSKYEFEVTLSSPFHAALEMVAYNAFAAQKEGVVGDIEGYNGEIDYQTYAKSEPLGTGPFTLHKWEQGTEAEVWRRDDYHGQVPSVAAVHWQIIEKTNPWYSYATQNVNADHPYVPSAKYDPNKVNIEGTDEKGHPYGTYGPLENGLTADYYRTAELVTYYFAFNTANVIKPARKAFAHALSQRELVAEVIGKPYKSAYFFTPPGIFPGGVNNYDEMAAEYPYGYGESRDDETQIEKARQIMEDAGYGPDNKYSFTLTSYQSSTWQQMANLMRDKLTQAHIDLNFEQTEFATMTQRGRNGNLDAYTGGWGADYPAADSFLQLLAPQYSQTDGSGTPISYLNWEGTEAAENARQAWSKIQNNTQVSEEAQQARNEAYLTMEKANWEDVCFVDVFHLNAEHFAYEWVDAPRRGPMGSSNAKFNDVEIGDRGEYE